MKLKPFVHFLSHSLPGNVVAFEIGFAIPLALTFIALNYADGTLTPGFTFQIILANFTGGLVCGVAFWFAVARRLVRNKQKLQHRSN